MTEPYNATKLFNVTIYVTINVTFTVIFNVTKEAISRKSFLM